MQQSQLCLSPLNLLQDRKMKASELPPPLKWIPLYIEFVSKVTNDLHAWDVLEVPAQPLQYILHLRFFSSLSKEDIKMLREGMAIWAKANNGKYQRSNIHKRDMKALLFIKTLKTEQANHPF